MNKYVDRNEHFVTLNILLFKKKTNEDISLLNVKLKK